MSKNKLKEIFFAKDDYETIISTFWIIPILLGVNKYTLRAKDNSGFYFVAYSLNIFLLEVRLLLLGNENHRAKKSKKPKVVPFTVTIWQSTETNKCMFIKSGYEHSRYWETLEGFEEVHTFYANNEEEMIKKLKEYEESSGNTVIPVE